MIGFKKQDTKALFKAVARQHGVSVAQVKREMKAAIKEASKDPAPEFIENFGNRTPTPEEFIYTVAKNVNY